MPGKFIIQSEEKPHHAVRANSMTLRALTVFLCIASVIAGWVLASTVAGSLHYLRPGPGFDFWTGAMPFLQSAVDGPWQWPLLWEQYAGAHRLVLSRLLFLLEWHCDSFRNYGLLFMSWAALFASAWIMAKAVWAEKYFDVTSRWLCVLLIVLGLGSAHHLNNMVYGFNQQWTSGLLLTLLGIQAVISSQTGTDHFKRRAFMLLALLCAVLVALTTFSLPAIILVWLMLCWLLQIDRKITLAIFLLLLLACLAYLSQLPLLASLTDNDVVIENHALFFIRAVFFLALASLRYLSSPLAEYSVPTGVVLAIAALAVCALAAKKQKPPAEVNPLFILALAYAAFALGMALSTALGRIEIQHAINPRFRSFVLPFLVFAGILFVHRIQQCKSGLRLLLSIALIVLSLLVIVPGHLRQLAKFSEEYDLYLPGSLALASGLSDVSAVHESRFAKFQVVDNEQMLKYRDFLKNHRRGIFATAFYQQIGRSISLENKSTALASGTLTALTGGGYRWEGTTDLCGADGRVAVADADGKIIGAGMVNRKLLASGWQTLYAVFLPYCRPGKPVPWTAFVPAGNPASTQEGVSLYAAVFVQDKALIIARTGSPATQ